MNIIDYVATLSFYIDLLLQKVASHIDNADALEFFSIIRILRWVLQVSKECWYCCDSC